MARCVFPAVGIALCACAGVVVASDFQPTDPSSSYRLSKLESQVLASFLDEMGLKLDPENKIEPPAPTPPPMPPDAEPPPDADPEPAPPPDHDTGFFDDDDFFDDDAFDGDAGFDAFVENSDREFEAAIAAWDAEFEAQLRRWEEGRKRHARRAQDYQEATVQLGSGPETEPLFALRDATIGAMQPGDFYVIPNAMSLAVKNQNPRGTCTAFAGVRGIETLLAQHGVRSDLSEQHYYAITKGCVTRPCSGSEGDATYTGYKALNRYRAGLLSETDCPYVARKDASDITLVRERACGGQRGVVESGKFFTTRSMNTVMNAIRSNQPVVLGFDVSCAYQLARGVIKANDPKANELARQLGMTCGGGHAMLGIGYMRLPPTMASEGRYCVIVANSWTDDWATGGYGCLTERYIKENGGYNHTVLQRIRLTDRGASVLAGGQ